MRQPPGAPALDSLPSSIVDLFRRAFLTNDRPKPREWIEPLDALAKSLKKCVLHSGHHYYKELRECPWCGIETQSRVRLFNFPLPGDSQRGHFRLDEIWKAIESVAPPDTSMIPWRNMLKAPEPSAEVASLARNRRYRFVVSIWFSAIAGLAIPLLIGFPLAFSFFLLVLAGCAAYAIGKPKRPVSVELIFQLRQPAPDPLLVELQARRRQMEEAARQLQERYDLEAGNERWGAKRDELLNRKETYENLAGIRDFKFEQLAKKDQFDEFLDKFEVSHSDVAGIGEAAIASLISHGVETAADITEDRLGQIPSLNESRVRRLLRWRQELEQKFVFEPDRNITPQPRIAVEKEIDALRRQLELELSSGANYLTRVKQETETNIQRLLPALVNARQEVAQADKDLQVASKRYSFIPILAALITTFLIGMAIMPSHDISPGLEVPPPIIPPGHTAPVELKSTQEALKFYSLGVKLAREENYTEAVIAFRKAVEIDPKINGAYEDLGYALYRLKNYEESANASKEAIKLRNDFGPYYNLGLAYMALEYWDGASTAFEFAIAHREKLSWEERHTLAYYYRGRSKTRLGEAGREIEKLESLLKAAPGLTVDRLELACLYLWVGRLKDARAQYEILKKNAPRLAEELMILIKKHESRPLAGVKPVIARGKKEHSWLTS